MQVTAGSPSEHIFGQVWLSGVTDQPGQGAGIEAQLGYGPAFDPPTQANWTWVDATYNLDSGNNDEYRARLTVKWAGTYAYAFRYRYRGGSWTYGDRSDAARLGNFHQSSGQAAARQIPQTMHFDAGLQQGDHGAGHGRTITLDGGFKGQAFADGHNGNPMPANVAAEQHHIPRLHAGGRNSPRGKANPRIGRIRQRHFRLCSCG